MVERRATLVQKVNPESGEKEWCLVSKSDPSRVLQYYGTKKPSPERVLETERRVQYYKHHKGSYGHLCDITENPRAFVNKFYGEDRNKAIELIEDYLVYNKHERMVYDRHDKERVMLQSIRSQLEDRRQSLEQSLVRNQLREEEV